MNNITLTGRIVREPEVRYTNTQKAVTRFTIANNDSKNPIFLDCVYWGELNTRYQKGIPVALEGKLEIDTYKDKKRYFITVSHITILDFEGRKQYEAASTRD